MQVFIHKEDILKKVAKEMPNLVLEFLPAYSPDYNIAEARLALSQRILSTSSF
jgi:hypothetical protein